MLRVDLPFSEAAYLREVTARRAYHVACVVTGVGVVGLLAALVIPWNGTAAGGLVLAVMATLCWGVIRMVATRRRLREASIGLELDASRRWVTMRGVHPNFNAAISSRTLDYQRR